VSFASREDDPSYEAFRGRLRELGHIEGRTTQVEFRSAQGDIDRLPRIAEELVRLQAAVIVVGNPAAARAMQRATSTIPIVIATSDPISSGLVANLARPGGNITGLSTLSGELGGKRLQLLKEAIPGLKRLAILWHPFTPTMARMLDNLRAVARALSIEVMAVSVNAPTDFAPAIESIRKARVHAVYLLESPLFYAHRATLAALALRARLPSIYAVKLFVDDGGLLSYGADFIDQARRTADYVDKILRGARPGDLPIEQATKLYFAVNLKTARALDLDIPPEVLARADEVIE
jgi:putative ABC transport system substrate-binding protein